MKDMGALWLPFTTSNLIFNGLLVQISEKYAFWGIDSLVYDGKF